ncbi:hypothetical protein COV16_07430 [Candidatus Woesearchaeota archaeon CG10_big_fil_rev_8_21_14_0_10_34_8]|nr:MAG: hypothetical protein COV16_07430 [Candidatus Woesearchaeota archaeon CG10_big_fil_rev_8_21_14_0_10_34_8]
MDFKVKKREVVDKEKYHKSDIDIAYEFTRRVHKEFGTFLRAVVLFGSTTEERDGKAKQGDIDLLLVVDDVTYFLTPEVVETYRVIVQRMIEKTSTRLHVTTLKFTSFWEYVRIGDPIGINMIRNGVALLDTGFFYPLQLLLHQGRLRPTPEAVHAYYSRSSTTLFNSRWHLMQATLDLYWAVIDSAHAALMMQGVIPPAPKKVADMLEEKLVKKKVLDKKHVKTMRTFYTISKMILHRKLKDIDGKTYEKYYADAKSFVDDIRKLVEAQSE